MCDGHSDVIVESPDWLKREGRPTVCIDRCIVHALVHLWAAGHTTLNSCCGHGTDAPSLVLTEGPKNVNTIRSCLREVDDREWTLLQWQLVEL